MCSRAEDRYVQRGVADVFNEGYNCETKKQRLNGEVHQIHQINTDRQTLENCDAIEGTYTYK